MTLDNPNSLRNPQARAFLALLDAALRVLPRPDRDEIVREIESHLVEREQAGDLSAALAALGQPDVFARTYLEDRELSQALTRPNPASLLFAVVNRSGRSLIAFLVGFLAVLLYLFSAAFAVMVVLKAITPDNVGLWVSPGHFSAGAIYGARQLGPERLGYWVVPIAAAAAFATYLLATALLRMVGAILVRRSPGLSAGA